MSRARSHSDPSSSPTHSPSTHTKSIRRYRLEERLSHLASTSESSTSSLQSSFSGLTLNPHTVLGESSRNGRTGSPTPSVTSISDEEDGTRVGEVDEGLKRWIGDGKGKGKGNGNGKGKERRLEEDEVEEGMAGRLPPEVLVQILRQLHNPRDLYAAIQVSRLWCLSGFSILWHKPHLTHTHQLVKFTRVLRSASTSLPYATSIRRLNLASIANHLTDYLIDGLELATRVDRVTLSGAEGISSIALKKFVGGLKEVTSIDLSMTANVEDTVVRMVAEHCERIQAIHMAGCKSVGDEGLKAVAEKRQQLRRLKIGGCHRVTDAAIIPLARACTLIIEFDLSHVPQITNAALYNIFTHSSHLRELRLVGNDNVNDQGIPSISDLLEEEDEDSDVEGLPWYAKIEGRRITPAFTSMDSLRVVDLTLCTGLNDTAVARLVANAPRIRHLTLAKCPLLTDAMLDSLGKLGKNLHHLQLGHLTEITDAGISKLAKHCTRIRYIDLTCCDKLTDASVVDLAQHLSKLHRIGLVKVKKITDEAIYALVERHATLERMHLSYCDNLTPKAIGHALNRLLRVTHLSLTGIPAFQTPELQQFCRATPAEYGPAQRESFCVYSGHGITALRNHLNLMSSAQINTSDEGSRRDSTSSQSSLTLPGTFTPPHHSVQPNPANPAYTVQYWTHSTQPWIRTNFSSSSRNAPRPDAVSRRSRHAPTQDASEDARSHRDRDQAPVFRYTARTTPVIEDPLATPGIPSNALMASAPNFFVPVSGPSRWSRPTESHAAPSNGARAVSVGSPRGPPQPPSSEEGHFPDSSSTVGQVGNARGEGIQRSDRNQTHTTTRRDATSQTSSSGSRNTGEEGERAGPFGWMVSRFGWERRNGTSGGGKSGDGSTGSGGMR